MVHKRHRDTEAVDGDTEVEEVDIESANSSFRMRQDKRRRVALAQAAGTSVASEGDNYQDLLNTDTDEDETEQQSDYSTRQNSSDDEQEDDKIDEIAATQFMHKQQSEHKDNIPAECGIIEEIYCRNFMCHSNLRIKPGPLINFVIGHNGSGKSAVLTALQVCLGENARHTNRGKSLKDMVKEGTDSAMVGVKIKNQGEGAYKPDTYGESIVVERHFSKAGSSSFKLKNTLGSSITTKKGDLDEILDYYGLQLDNPINVLTQDRARSFLAQSSETEKYKFFIKGTQLELLNHDYTIIEENLDAVEAKIETRTEDVAELKRQFDEAERLKKRADDAAQIWTRIKAIQREQAWAQIGEQEVVIADAENEVVAAQERVGDAEREAEEASARYDGRNVAKEAAERGLQEHQAQQGPAQGNFDTAKEKFNDNKDKLIKHNATERTIKDEFKKASSEIRRLDSEISEERKRLAEEHGEAHTQRLQDLDELKEKVEQTKQDHRSHTERRPDLEQQLQDAQQQHTNAKGPIESAKKEVDDAKLRLNTLQRDQGRKWAPYHSRMEAFCREIDKETRWRSKPIGPMGLYVHLLKPEWASILETTFGGALFGFAVTCKYDQNLLDQVSKRVGCSVTSFIGSAQRLDTTDKEPQGDVDTILRVLRIDSDLIRNTLIINHAADQTVLFRDLDEGKKFMYNSGRPRNVKATLTMQPKDKSRGQRFEYSRHQGERVSPIHAYKSLFRMKADRKEEIRIQQERVQDAQQRFGQAEQRSREARNVVEKAGQALVRHKREERDLKIAIQTAEDAVESKQAEIDAKRPKDGILQELERQKQAAEEEKEAAKGSIQDMVAQKEKLDETAHELKTAMEAAQAELHKVNGHILKATTKLQKTEEAREIALVEKNRAYDHVDFVRQEVVQKQEDVVNQKNVLEEWLPQAREIAPERVPVGAGNNSDILAKRAEELTAQHERTEQTQGGTREEISAAWHEARTKYDTARRTLKKLRSEAKKMKEALAERHRRWGLFRKYISMRTRIQFRYLLQERNFRGRVNLCHQSKTLFIHIEPDNTKASDAGRQAKTLSGGEKSFSTICLLLSIWEAMGSPIRCLDEFDVFMDSANRAQSMGLMIKTARRSVGRQFVLITPQAMGNVELGDDVKIHKMSDPERGRRAHGQTELNFGTA